MHMNILKAALFTPTSFGWGLPLLLEDEPGTAKTSVIKSYAESIGLPIRVLSPGTDGEGAFGCIPVPEGGVLTYPPPEWSKQFTDGGIIFCDEVTTAPPLLQTSIMGILTERRIGGLKFGRRVRTIGACNPVETAANGYDLAPPLANRFGHLKWGAPSVEEHTAYMMSRADTAGLIEVTTSAKALEDAVMHGWGDHYARAVGLETSFLGAQPDTKNKFPKAGAAAGRAWPSDRTWEYATLALASSYAHNLTALERDLFVEGFIGKEAYEAFSTFIEEADLPNIADLLDGKISWKHDPKRLDKTAAVLGAAQALITPANAARRKERADVLWSILESACKTAGDLCVPTVKGLMDAKLVATKASVKTLAMMHPVLAASGITIGQVAGI